MHIIFLPPISPKQGTYSNAHGIQLSKRMFNDTHTYTHINRVDSMFAPIQGETALLCNDVSHWLGASLESAIHIMLFLGKMNKT